MTIKRVDASFIVDDDPAGPFDCAAAINAAALAADYAEAAQSGRIMPSASATPENNGDVVFEFTSDTTFTIKAKGSDGIVRSVTLTLT